MSREGRKDKGSSSPTTTSLIFSQEVLPLDVYINIEQSQVEGRVYSCNISSHVSVIRSSSHGGGRLS